MTTRIAKPTAAERDIPAGYLELLRGFRLRPIFTKADYEAALRMIEPLMMRDNLSDDEEEYVDVLAALIEDYEAEHYPIHDAPPIEVLRALVASSGRTQAMIAKEAGLAESTVSEILKGKRGMGRKHIEAFAQLFSVDPALFMASSGKADKTAS